MLEYGAKIRVGLAKRNLKQIALAKFANVSSTTVGDSWIKKSKKPHFDHAVSIETFFNGEITMTDMGHE